MRLKSIIFLAALLFCVTATHAQFSIQVIATDGVYYDTLTLGTAVGATNGIDASQGEIEQPPFPPAGAFATRFVAFNGVSIGQGTKRDFRGYTYAGQNITYKIKSQPSSDGHYADSVQLIWPSDLATTGGGYWHLSSPESDVDMTLQSSVFVSSDNPTVTITTGDKTSFTTFTYQRFWQDASTKGNKLVGNKRDLKNFYWPNVHNVGEELTAGLTGGATLMKVGGSDTQTVIVKKYGDLLKDAIVKGNTHSPDSIFCLDYYPHSIKGKSYPGFDAPVQKNSGKLKKPLKTIDPTPGKGLQSYLFAQLMTLKFNLAASTAGKTPSNLGSVVILDASPFAGDSISTLVASADSAWSCQSTGATMKEITDELEKMNKAFNRSASVGDPLDTAHCDTVAGTPWRVQNIGGHLKPAAKNSLRLAGWIQLAKVPWLRAGATSASAGTFPAIVENTHPAGFVLGQNYPNPFNPTTTIPFVLQQDGIVTVKVFNLLGQEVATLINEEMSSGAQQVSFNAANVSTGVYFYRITVNDPLSGRVQFTDVRRMLLVK